MHSAEYTRFRINIIYFIVHVRIHLYIIYPSLESRIYQDYAMTACLTATAIIPRHLQRRPRSFWSTNYPCYVPSPTRTNIFQTDQRILWAFPKFSNQLRAALVLVGLKWVLDEQDLISNPEEEEQFSPSRSSLTTVDDRSSKLYYN